VGPRCRDTGAAARVFRRALREPWVATAATMGCELPPARLMALVISSSDERGIRLDTFCRIIMFKLAENSDREGHQSNSVIGKLGNKNAYEFADL
jgi:hypothetical protein